MEIYSLILMMFGNMDADFLTKKMYQEDKKVIEYIMDSKVSAVVPYKLQKSNEYSLDYSFKIGGNSFVNNINYLPEDIIKEKIKEAIPVKIQKKAVVVIESLFVIAKEIKIDPIFLLSTVWTESTFRENALSHKGATGYLQLMPKTKKYLKKIITKKEFERIKLKLANTSMSDSSKENLILGSFYMKMLKNKFLDPHIALAAYNMGPGWVMSQLNENRPVGNKNLYVNNIKHKYRKIASVFIASR